MTETIGDGVPIVHIESATPQRDEVRHLWVREPWNSQSRFVPLCDSVEPVKSTKLQTSRLYPSDYEEEGSTVCTACMDTDEFQQYHEFSTQRRRGRSERRDESSWWERYDVTVSDVDDAQPPLEAHDEGYVIVDESWRDAGKSEPEYFRKLHAYRPVEDKLGMWTSLCNIPSHTKNTDGLLSVTPDSFNNWLSSCEVCQNIVERSEDYDAEVESPAANVRFDPFGVFDSEDRIEQLPDPPLEWTCNQCGRSFEKIGLHWGHPSSSCEYPRPSPYQQSLLTGIWLAGGSLELNGEHPIIRKTSVNRFVLEWLKSELGVWGTDVSESISKTEQKKNIESGFGYTNANSNTQYRITTRTCPFLSNLLGREVEDIVLTPVVAKVLYSFRGWVVDNSAIGMRHRDGSGLVKVLHKAGFTETSLYEPETGKNQFSIVLSSSDSRRFIEWIGGPLPGFENKEPQFRTEGPQGMSATRRVTPVLSKEDMGIPTDNSPIPPTIVSSEEVTAVKTALRACANVGRTLHSEVDAHINDLPDEPEVIGTVNLEPDWEWVGVQLAKLGLTTMAQRAFNKELTPQEVYTDVLDAIYANMNNPDVDLDVGAPFDGAMSTVEQPVDPEIVTQYKNQVGVA